jgi:hypothetical protein
MRLQRLINILVNHKKIDPNKLSNSISLSFSLFLSLPFFIFRRSLELILLLDDIFY